MSASRSSTLFRTEDLLLPGCSPYRPNTTTIRPLNWYTHIIVSFSGGKDSLALALELLRRGVAPDRMVLWHQAVDGWPGSRDFMDWPCTASYCRAVARSLGIPIRYQWRVGGFERELLKDRDRIAAVSFERMDGRLGMGGGVNGAISTRRRFPQVSTDLRVRWCSAALKIDVAAIAMNNDPAFRHAARVLFLTGERRGESSARARYAEAEQHRCHTSLRHVDHWRMGIDWTEQEVWDRLREARVMPHPAYRLGWGRVSCALCIFGQADQWASARLVAPDQFERVARYELEFGVTIHRDRTVTQLADAGTPYPECRDRSLVALAMGHDYPDELARVPVGQQWALPAGAFRACGGPS